MEFNGMRRMLSFARKCVDDYHMIEDGDVIAAGVSGGKDSLTMLAVLRALSVFYPKRFTLKAITVDMGFEGADFDGIRRFCDDLDVEFILLPSQLGHIIFDLRKESNPCSLCAKMRRGMLNEAAVAAGCNKVALGHHFDDLIETFFLALIHEGRLGAYPPVTYLSNTGLKVIRPMSYAQEKDIKYFVRHNEIPVFNNPCPANKQTQREETKRQIALLEKQYKGVKHRIFGAMKKANVDGWGGCLQTDGADDETKAE